MIINTDIPGISRYAIFLAASLIIGFVLATLLLVKRKASKLEITGSLMVNISLVIYMGLQYTLLANLIKGKSGIGFSGMGGGIGMIIGTVIMYLVFKDSSLIYVYCTVTPLMYAVSKIGCFFAGCCGGIKYHGPGAVTYIGKADYIVDYPTLPVPLIESLCFGIIFIIMLSEYLKRKMNFQKCLIYTIICALTKGLLDCLRMDHVGKIITINQIACIAVIVAAVATLFVLRRKQIANVRFTFM